MKRIIVFGATGNTGIYFVDYCLSRLDKNEYEVIAVGRKKTDYFHRNGINYIRLDIRNIDDFNKLPRENIYAIINMSGILPAYSENNNYFDYVDVNIKGSLAIMEYARTANADRVLYLQTWAEMAGYWNKETILSPKMERKLCYTGDHAFYSISKSTVVEMMKHYQEEYGIKSFVFRLPNIYLYSPINEYYVNGKKKPIAYRKMINQAIKSEDIEMWGNPYAFKDIVYVKDLCQMLFKAVFAKVDGGTYCVGTGVKTTLEEQINGIIEIFCPKNKISKIILKPSMPTFVSFVMDIENAKEELGYAPEYNYLSMLEDYKIEKNKKRFDELWEQQEEK